MIRVGFLGRSSKLAEIIKLFDSNNEYEVTFIWTSKEAQHHNFSANDFKELAQTINCQYIYSPIINQEISIPNTDLVVSMNFISIIPKWFLEKFKYGVINSHAGNLPKYKGNACPNWAILNDEKEICLTIHVMTEELDSGPIISQEFFTLKKDTYIGEVYKWLDEIVPNLYFNSVEKIINGYLPIEQKGKTLRTFPRKPEDSRLNFNKNLMWNYKIIRASSRPFNGAFCYLNSYENILVIWKAIPIKLNYEFLAVSGQIIEKFDEEKSFVIGINNQALKILDYNLNDYSKEISYSYVCSSMRNRLI